MENATSTVPDKKTKTCPHCKKEVDFGATKCPHCQSDLRAWWNRHPVLTVIGILFLVGVAFSGTNGSNGTSVTDGQQGYLRNSKVTTLPVFVTQQALDQFTQDNINHDTYDQQAMLANGQIFFVPNGTQVLVIGTNIGTRKVRILFGDRTGQSGYVYMEEVSAN